MSGVENVLANFKRLEAENDQLRTDLAAAEERANRWAYKMTLLVMWVRQNCTAEQAAEARNFASGVSSEGGPT